MYQAAVSGRLLHLTHAAPKSARNRNRRQRQCQDRAARRIPRGARVDLLGEARARIALELLADDQPKQPLLAFSFLGTDVACTD